jgi:hypothetical protein
MPFLALGLLNSMAVTLFMYQYARPLADLVNSFLAIDAAKL